MNKVFKYLRVSASHIINDLIKLSAASVSYPILVTGYDCWRVQVSAASVSYPILVTGSDCWRVLVSAAECCKCFLPSSSDWI